MEETASILRGMLVHIELAEAASAETKPDWQEFAKQLEHCRDEVKRVYELNEIDLSFRLLCNYYRFLLSQASSECDKSSLAEFKYHILELSSACQPQIR